MRGHTPGPWIVLGERPGPRSLLVDICSDPPGDDFGVVVAADCDIQNMADAHLIAAAPDLLHALKTIVDAGGWYNSALELGPHYDGEELEKMARLAIAKAEGKE